MSGQFDEDAFDQFLTEQEGKKAADPPKEPPATELKPETPPPEPPGGEQPPEEPFPGYNDLPEATRAAIDARLQAAENARQEAAQRYQMLHGQVAPLQRKLAKFEQDHSRTQTRTAPEPGRTGQPGTEQKRLERWEQLKASLGDDAEAIEELVSTQLESVRKDLAPVTEKLTKFEQAAEVENRRAELADAYPDWQDIIPSPDFQGWMHNLGQRNPRLFNRFVDGLRAGDVDVHVAALDLFHEHAQAAPKQPPKVRKPDPTPSPRRSGGASSQPSAGRNYNGIDEDAFDAWASQQRG